MKTAEFHVKSGSAFGKRVPDHHGAKKLVGKAVVSRVLWPDGHGAKNPIFFSDGTSSSYVWCYFLQEWLRRNNEDAYVAPLEVWTNNLDVPLQALWEKSAPGRVNIHLAPGDFSYMHFATFGVQTEQWVGEHCKRAVSVLSATALDAELGPCSSSDYARGIKRAVMEHANMLVVVADSSKLRKKRDPSQAASPNLWREWVDNRASQGRLFVVMNRTKDADYLKRSPFKGFPDLRNDDEIENENYWALKETLKQQLIVV